MTEEKAQLKANLHTGAARVASTANAKAKSATGWRRWLYAAAAILAGAVAFFTATACTASYSQTAAGDISATVTVVQPSSK
jgi:Rieske Fe-S protein